MNSRWLQIFATLSMALRGAPANGAPPPGELRWVVGWVGPSHGPYPAGNASAQPDLSQVFPSPRSGARDQSFRMIVKPEIWGCEARLRFSNAFGSQAVTFARVYLGLQQSSAALVAGTNRPVAFGGKSQTTVPAGGSVWSDPVALPFACDAASAATLAATLAGRKLAVSFHVPGESGPLTWHAKALQTSYLTAPGAGAKTADEGEAGFPFSTTSWYFVDALEMRVAAESHAIVAFGDSITDGTNSTLNGDDRWPDVLARRLRAAYGNRVSVVNSGIGGNQVVGPKVYSLTDPPSGGPSALARLERDVLTLSGVRAVIWFEGINDFNKTNAASFEAVKAGLIEGVTRLRAKIPGIRVIGATVTSALGSTSGNHGQPEQEQKRQALNTFIRGSRLFDGVADFDRAVLDPSTGKLRAPFVHNTTIGGAGDGLHPNRLGYLAMAMAIDIAPFKPVARPTPAAAAR